MPVAATDFSYSDQTLSYRRTGRQCILSAGPLYRQAIHWTWRCRATGFECQTRRNAYNAGWQPGIDANGTLVTNGQPVLSEAGGHVRAGNRYRH